MLRRLAISVLFLAAAALSAQTASAGSIWALDNNNDLFAFDHASPQDLTAGHSIIGLGEGERLLNIDFDPRTGQLIGISNRNRLLSINTSTGQATPLNTAFTPALNGIAFGFDVNPAVASQSRVVSAADQNLRLDNFAASVLAATNLAFAPSDPNAGKNANIEALAYSNNIPTATTTTAYAIDPVQDELVRIGSVNGSPSAPDAGQLTTIGPLGVDVGHVVGMDITRDGVAFAAMQPSTSSFSDLYLINLTTGHATSLGNIIGGIQVRDIAADPTVNFAIPEPSGIFAVIALAGLVARRRR